MSSKSMQWFGGILLISISALLPGSLIAGCFEAKFEDKPLVQPPVQDQGAPGSGVIAGQYIVGLKQGTPADELARTEGFVEAEGGKIIHNYESLMPAFAAQIPARALRQLQNSPHVAYIEADHRIQPTSIQACAPSWGLDRIDQKSLPLNHAYVSTDEYPGKDIDIFVFDTGIDAQHPDLGGRVVDWFDATANKSGGQGLDCHGHGTHVAGIVGGREYGLAKEASLLSIQIFDCPAACGPSQGVEGAESNIVAGFVHLRDMIEKRGKPSIVLLGTAQKGISTPISKAMEAVKASLQSQQSAALLAPLYVLSAGNDGTPACESWYGGSIFEPLKPETLVVGSIGASDERSFFSNHGACVDVFAPGQGIRSLSASTGDCSSQPFTELSGTSQAAAHVAGVAALSWARTPNAAAAEIRAALLGETSAGKIDTGDGSPNKIIYSDSKKAGLQLPTNCTGSSKTCTAGDGVVCCDGQTECNRSIVCEHGECTTCGLEGTACCMDSGKPYGVCGEHLTCDKSNTCRCGGLGQECCGGPDGTCDNGLGCSKDFKVCGGCGVKDAPCCNGTECGNGLTCNGGTCKECGGLNKSCCEGAVCESGMACSEGICKPCGGEGQLCCGTTDCAVGLECIGGTCVLCGGNQQVCCGGINCDSGFGCINDACQTCGMLAQSCCPKLTCSGDMNCTGNTCKGDCDGICISGFSIESTNGFSSGAECIGWVSSQCESAALNEGLPKKGAHQVYYNDKLISSNAECGQKNQACCDKFGKNCSGMLSCKQCSPSSVSITSGSVVSHDCCQ